MVVLLFSAAVVAGAVWWMEPGLPDWLGAWRTAPIPPRVALVNDRPDVPPDAGTHADVPERGAAPAESGQAPAVNNRIASLLAAGKEALQRGDLLSARAYFSDSVASGLSEPEWTLIRAELTRLGNETILSPRVSPGDPYVERYVIRPGDSLGKIARKNKISVDLLGAINGIADINRIRAGQRIKLVKGPFRAVVNKSAYTLDVYLENTFVAQYRVGLGAEDSTPTGVWRVATKLKNPTYYPPRGGAIIAADDPDNPLGERWIGLTGVSGEAAGQMRYGIHGTNDADSIGKSVSLGCVRMYNEDAEALYRFLVEEHSTVTVQE